MNKANCLAKFCREKIYTSSDWRKAMLAKRQELAKQGIVNFDENPEFTELTQCKGNIDDEFMDETGCAGMNNMGKVKTPVFNPYANNPNYKHKICQKGFIINPFPPFNCIPKKQATAKARAPSARARTPSARARTPSARARAPSARARTPSAAKPKRCPKGFNRSKKTGNCEAKK